ncbi:hypothetical protein BKA70DRAFT_347894 [Coprinopsis sp. MPI-PUGE-AT-0042]|nr:hypothetical protein BKA70DRAFT_347894 [Coprinopsis sp. MPI-PUGE-AT-0042]
MDTDPNLFPLLRSNDALPGHLSPVLDASVDNQTRRLQVRNEETFPLLFEFGRSTLEKDKILSQSDDPPSLSAAVRSIPAEILAKIIHWAIGGSGRFVDSDARHTFLHLRQVSTIWRRTAFSTPYLWRYLSVDTKKGLGRDPYLAMTALTRLIPQWFERAGREAEVHLDLGGWMEGDDYHVDWFGAIWGGKERSYRLATNVFWGILS